MIHLHASQKTLNTSRLKASVLICDSNIDQTMQNWYVSVCGSSFIGKNIVLYVHEPSLLTIVVKSKTIKTTYQSFVKQLQQFLERHNFPQQFILNEINLTNEFVVGKTTNKSMVAHINNIIFNFTNWCSRFNSYEDINCATMEDRQMNYLFKNKNEKDFTFTNEYWEKLLNVKLKKC